jgi:myo-inositol 2-dehydrogenase/D-chiro-inositol 1-dehydrogenase
MEIGVAVLGAGRIGRLHAENLTASVRGARVRLIADPRSERAREAAGACGMGVRALADPFAACRDAEIGAVVIASSTDTHARLIEEAASAGKHIFCEKPLDLDPVRIQRALDAVRAAGVQLQVGFNRRFDPSFARVAALVRAGGAGTPHLVRITSRDPQPPPADYVQVSGGIFLDMTIHDLDLARFLVGDEIVQVFATGSVLVDEAIGRAGDVDTAAVVLRFAGGTLACIDNSRRAVYGYDQRVEVFGSQGCIVAGNQTPTSVGVWSGSGQLHEPPLHFFLERYQESYIEEMRSFVECIATGRPVPVSGEDGLRAVELALAAQRSLETGMPVSTLPPGAEIAA